MDFNENPRVFLMDDSKLNIKCHKGPSKHVTIVKVREGGGGSTAVTPAREGAFRSPSIGGTPLNFTPIGRSSGGRSAFITPVRGGAFRSPPIGGSRGMRHSVEAEQQRQQKVVVCPSLNRRHHHLLHPFLEGDH